MNRARGIESQASGWIGWFVYVTRVIRLYALRAYKRSPNGSLRGSPRPIRRLIRVAQALGLTPVGSLENLTPWRKEGAVMGRISRAL